MSKYELLERIGVGGMAEIYRGKSLSVGGFEKLVAIKKILPHLGRDERFVQMLIHEARINASLKQRNIVQIYDVGVGDDGEYFLVMEYVPGCDLANLMKALERGGRFELPIEVALFIGGELCEALEHAHRAVDAKGKPAALIHRDVSPANVLVSYGGEVKLTDFGIAKKVDEASVVASIKGKFAYMSPEQAAARPLDGRSDLFALGIILWELTVGKRLFSGLSDFDALRMVREGKIQRPRDATSDFDKQLDRIVMKALAPKVDDRYERAADLAADLRDVRFRLAGAASPAAELAAMVRNRFPPSESDRLAIAGAQPVGLDPAAVAVMLPQMPAASSTQGNRQRSFVEISTAAAFKFEGPGADLAPDAALGGLLMTSPEETRVLRRQPSLRAAPATATEAAGPAAPPPPPAAALRESRPARAGVAQAAAAPAPPPAPASPSKRGSAATARAPASLPRGKPRSVTGVQRDERSARLQRELFDDVSSLQKIPSRPSTLAPAGAGLHDDDAPTSFHVAAPEDDGGVRRGQPDALPPLVPPGLDDPHAGDAHGHGPHDDDDYEDERSRKIRLGVVIAAVTLIALGVAAYLSGMVG
ncbi:MAG: serine/threonine protein kinase [Deltaproteobacteria bacterium]|nr:serine/threonine protein kinase [Deltaproteobacteria bacterium]